MFSPGSSVGVLYAPRCLQGMQLYGAVGSRVVRVKLGNTESFNGFLLHIHDDMPLHCGILSLSAAGEG